MVDRPSEPDSAGGSAEPEDPPLGPAESLALIQHQREETDRQLGGNPLVFFLPWGIAYLIGFGLLFLRQGFDGITPIVDMPRAFPLTILGVLLAAAMAITGYLGAKSGQHLSGPSVQQGMMYGLTWFVGFAGVMTIAGRFADQLPQREADLLWASIAVALVGLLTMAGGVVWRDWIQFFFGLWILIVNAVGVALGPGWHSLISATAGGGGLILMGLYMHLRLRHRWRW